jgi:hypothetical protein
MLITSAAEKIAIDLIAQLAHKIIEGGNYNCRTVLLDDFNEKVHAS